PDKKMTHDEIAKFSPKDAAAYPRYEAMLERAADFIEPMLEMTPPDLRSLHPRNLATLAKLAWRFRGLGRDMYDVVRILTGNAVDLLDAWFESEELKVTLATDAVIGAFASPSTPGTAYVLFHHVMGETNGVRGVWGYVRGGMGGLTQALAKAAQAHGAEIRTGAEVARIDIRDGVATGVVLADGTEFRAKVVASNATPAVTFLKLVEPGKLPRAFVQDVERISYDSAVVKINLALDGLPDFRALPGREPGPQHRGTIHISPTLAYIEEAFRDAALGKPSARPMLECTIPSVVDPTVAPPGKHLMNIFVQYAPYNLAEGSWDEIKGAFFERCMDVLEEYAPNIRDIILHKQILTPLDMEREYGLTGGNIFHGEMTLDQMLFMRPVPGYADYRTPVAGLYLCGSGAHPGGGVMGAPGYNAAQEILRDWRKKA
ncbi:MAG: NAD(P)/FAD-dependent oxidoreductase, partial [Caldilineae bacterium]